MIAGRIAVLFVVAAGCGSSFQVTTASHDNNCRRAAEIAGTGMTPDRLEMGSVPPPLPEGVDDPVGVIIDPQPRPARISQDAPTIGFPDPDRRKAVIVGGTDVAPETLKRRFEAALDQLGLEPDRGTHEIRIGGKLTEYSFSYAGRDVRGSATVIRCRGAARVVVSQTLVP